MTQEEKAKHYDEALERASKLQENSNGMILKKWLWDVFPELKESEDEKIRKAIIRILKGETSYTSKEDADKYVAWLEKQSKEISWEPSKEESAEDDVRRRSTIQVLEYARSLDTYNQYGKANIDKNIAWLEKQGEENMSETSIKDAEEEVRQYLCGSGNEKHIAEFMRRYANWNRQREEWDRSLFDALIQRGR